MNSLRSYILISLLCSVSFLRSAEVRSEEVIKDPTIVAQIMQVLRGTLTKNALYVRVEYYDGCVRNALIDTVAFNAVQGEKNKELKECDRAAEEWIEDQELVDRFENLSQ